MLRIRNLKRRSEYEYECEYQPENRGDWGFVTYNFETRILDVIRLASDDPEDSLFHKKHIPGAIEKALRIGETEALLMWY